MAAFASTVKVDWSANPRLLLEYAEDVASSTLTIIDSDGGDEEGHPQPANAAPNGRSSLQRLELEQSKLLLKNSISPIPLHKSLVLLSEIDRRGDPSLQQYGRLALAKALAFRVGNLKFGPEVGLGRIKEDAPVVDIWLEGVRTIANDISLVRNPSTAPAQVFRADAREVHQTLAQDSVDIVITSPPYPNEKDYTRTTRLESVVLGLIRDRPHLRELKQDLIRSNTRGVYKSDTDDQEVARHYEIQGIAKAIERRRVELGKTSGFERLYPRVTLLYFGGIARHLASLRSVLRNGAKLAYVVGDQASYLRVMIRTGKFIAELAQSLGYRVIGIDLFRTRFSTVTGAQLREEVVLLEWSGA